jgi:signal transduction histidine kinase
MLLRAAEFYEREQRSSQEFSRQLIESQEADRKRVAGELHDHLGQELMVIINRAHIGVKRSTDDASKAEFNEIARAASLGIEQVREIAYDLSPYHLEQLGLIDVLKTMVEKISEISTTTFTVDVDTAPWRFSKAEDMNIYRIVQECINNIVKHSAATHAEISFKQSDSHLEVIVRDNGKGFDVVTGSVSHGARRGFGLAGLSERINLLHGSLAIDSTPHHGTAITIMIPFCKSEESQ